MNNQKEDIKRAAEVAQFRFGVIAPVVQDLYPDPSRTAYYKRVASSPFTLPDGSVVEYNYKTIELFLLIKHRLFQKQLLLRSHHHLKHMINTCFFFFRHTRTTIYSIYCWFIFINQGQLG